MKAICWPLFSGDITDQNENFGDTQLSDFANAESNSPKVEFGRKLWSDPVWHHHKLKSAGDGEMTGSPHFHSQRHSKWMTDQGTSDPLDHWDVKEQGAEDIGSDASKGPQVDHPRAEDPKVNLPKSQPSRKEQSVKNKTKSSWQQALTTPSPPPVFRSGSGLPSQSQFPSHMRNRNQPHPTTTQNLSEDALRQQELDLFYKTYDPKEGIVTAIVLGGFFVFVSLLVLYKTKCKPMWKNRRKRLTNTPVTQSVVEGDSFGGGPNGSLSFPYPPGLDPAAPVIVEDETTFNGEDDYGFECIPLQPICNEDYNDEDDDIYFLDEFGNYVFPLSTPTIPGSCSCPSNEDLAYNARRVSQVKMLLLCCKIVCDSKTKTSPLVNCHLFCHGPGGLEIDFLGWQSIKFIKVNFFQKNKSDYNY